MSVEEIAKFLEDRGINPQKILDDKIDAGLLACLQKDYPSLLERIIPNEVVRIAVVQQFCVNPDKYDKKTRSAQELPGKFQKTSDTKKSCSQAFLDQGEKTVTKLTPASSDKEQKKLDRTSCLAQALKTKVGVAGRETVLKSKSKSGYRGNQNARKSTKRVEFMWYINEDEEGESSYRRVKSHEGGCLRTETLPVGATMQDLLEHAKILFYPNGYSRHFGDVSHYLHELRDFQKEEIVASETLGSFSTRTLVKPPIRFHLFSSVIEHSEEDCSDFSFKGFQHDKAETPTSSKRKLTYSEVEEIIQEEPPKKLKEETNLTNDISKSPRKSNASLMLTTCKESDISKNDSHPRVEEICDVGLFPLLEDLKFEGQPMKGSDLTVSHMFDTIMGFSPLEVNYINFKESSYSEVLIKNTYFDKRMCHSFATPEKPYTPEYSPLKDGYEIKSIKKGSKIFVEVESLETLSSQRTYRFPSAVSMASSEILHHPTEVWGHLEKGIELAVVTRRDPNSVKFTWVKDGEIMIEDRGICLIYTDTPGRYNVIVEYEGNVEISKSVMLSPVTEAPYFQCGPVHPAKF